MIGSNGGEQEDLGKPSLPITIIPEDECGEVFAALFINETDQLLGGVLLF